MKECEEKRKKDGWEEERREVEEERCGCGEWMSFVPQARSIATLGSSLEKCLEQPYISRK